MDLKSKLNKIIFGTDVSDLENLKKVVNDIASQVPALSRYMDIDREFYLDKQKNLINSIIRDENLLAISPDQNRIKRYIEYESIVKKIPYVKRALIVITQNILSPDDYTKDYFEINLDDRKSKELVNFFIEKLKLNKRSFSIIYKTLLYGDYFIELVDEDSFSDIKSNVLLREHEEDIKISIELSEENNKKRTLYKPMVFLEHHPSEVVVIGDERNIIGYLVFPNVKKNIIGNVQTYNPFTSGFNIDNQISLSKSLANKIITRLLKEKINSKINNMAIDKIIKNTEPELREVIMNMIISLFNSNDGNYENQISIRYVPPSKMVHFKLSFGDDNNCPYGTSKISGLEYISKVLITIEACNLLYRLNKSIDRRLFHVEIGSSRDVQTPIQQIIRTLSKRRFSIDSGIDEIPSTLSSFEDIFVPMKNGRRYIEVDNVSSGNINISMEDWKELRDSLIAGLEVPPAYLAIEQNYETRGTLTQENVVFAITILNYQKEFSELFTELFKKVYILSTRKKDLNIIKNLKLTFKPPTKLLIERYSEMASNFMSLVEAGKLANLPPEVLFNKFFGELIEEKDIIKSKINEVSDILLGKKSNEEQGMGRL